jgi:hypothetical protein
MTLLNIHNLSQSANEIGPDQLFSDFFEDVIRNKEDLIYITENKNINDLIREEILTTTIDKDEVHWLYKFLIMSDDERDSLKINYAINSSLHESIDSFASQCPNLFLVTQTVRAMSKRDPRPRFALQHEVYFKEYDRYTHYVTQVAGNSREFFSNKVRFGEFLHQLTRRAAGLEPT